ncbi:hypothetical protein EVAR_32135_1 [Eumeta japonica]|uniref:Uncharacterized protein n=1 Tax=Eumeta variegata TaxID=151549 RepID=A0A4C1V5J3_EUMVA|nr:hypothetical protein EVAR_32135_1 [Eumeta japonica]
MVDGVISQHKTSRNSFYFQASGAAGVKRIHAFARSLATRKSYLALSRTPNEICMRERGRGLVHLLWHPIPTQLERNRMSHTKDSGNALVLWRCGCRWAAETAYSLGAPTLLCPSERL